MDKIFGPGNLFVTLAKRQVFGVVGIDGLAGPTETVVIADDAARPEWVAADLLAQAEHDVLAAAILLTPSHNLAEAVQVEVAQQLESPAGRRSSQSALRSRSGIVLTATWMKPWRWPTATPRSTCAWRCTIPGAGRKR